MQVIIDEIADFNEKEFDMLLHRHPLGSSPAHWVGSATKPAIPARAAASHKKAKAAKKARRAARR